MKPTTKLSILLLALAMLLGVMSACTSPLPTLPSLTDTPSSAPATADTTEAYVPQTDEELFDLLSQTLTDPDRRYYISRLSGHLLADFVALYQGVLAFEEYIELPIPLTSKELEALVLYLEYDCPELMYFMDEAGSYTFRWSDATETKIKGIYPPYGMTKDEYQTKEAAVRAKIDALIAETKDLPRYEAERLIFDRLVSSCRYSYEAEDSNNAYGVLVNGVARCEGYSRTFTWLMRELDIPCFAIFGDSTSGQLPHSWNVICLGDAYYEVDITHDIVVDGNGNPVPNAYSHFNVTSAVHQNDFSLWEACTLLAPLPDRTATADNYHIKQNRYATSQENALLLLSQSLTEHKTEKIGVFSIRFAEQADFDAFLHNLNSEITAWCHENQIPLSYQYHQFTETLVLQLVIQYA